MATISKNLVIVRGGGDLATGVIHKLARSGFSILILEQEFPTVIRRTVAFAQAIFEGQSAVEGLMAIKMANLEAAQKALATGMRGQLPILVDPHGDAIEQLRPEVVVDATMAKKNLGTHLQMAPIVVALGPGFMAGRDVHAVIETSRGHDLGRIIFNGPAAANTGVPGTIGGFNRERIIRAPAGGKIKNLAKIGDDVQCGQIVAWVEDSPVTAPLDGVLRGLIAPGAMVTPHLKIGDIDPRKQIEHCFTISDKARAIAGGVLEAILFLRRQTSQTLNSQGL